MPKELEKIYDPQQVEGRTYSFWLDGGYFRAERDERKKPYTIAMPPPNITGRLHLGHALDNTLQDILTRFRRMQGYAALWLPGTDHASIATEAKIVEAMREEGLTKADIGREAFLERAWAWQKKYGGEITSQLKRLGSSCDWSRERFTMDDGCNEAVIEAFVNLYNKGLIYRGERIVNWCPHCKTSISDAEVEHEESAGHLWHVRYPLSDGSGHIEIATTRPETMLGDAAIAVHPEDERYTALVGKSVILPLVGREIPIIADDYVEQCFGTGALKITPAHDPNDFEVGLRHSLPIINVFDETATVNKLGGSYAGMERYAARKAVLKDLEAGGFLIKTEDHTHNVGSCYRCDTTIEPWVSMQWFVSMTPLAEPAIAAVRDGRIKMVPERFDKIYYNWMENIKDWCISRQLWWGHRIPAWHCADCGHIAVAHSAPAACPECGSGSLVQDPDTLDTWFSSALWPFSTLGWPHKTDDLEYFYPTNTVVPGYDILFFWVARMIFSGLEHMGDVPFDTVFLHGIIRDAEGRKMSKSLGNGVDPLEIIDEYGADALRLSLATGNSPGNDMRFNDEKIRASRNFANKLWNAARFILMNLPDIGAHRPGLPDELATEDRWLLSKYNSLIAEVTANLEGFELGVATGKLYDFIWDVYCDWYIELCKARLSAGGAAADNARRVLVYVMDGLLRMLHPVMPFITEEIWQALPHEGESIMIAEWPVCSDALSFKAEEASFEQVMALIKGIRNARAELAVPPSKKCSVYIETTQPGIFEGCEPFMQRLASAGEVEIGLFFDISGAIQVITPAARALLPMEELIDKDKELARLSKERESSEASIAQLRGKLSNESFVARAPEAVVQAERDKLAAAEQKLAKILESLAALK